MSVTVCSGIKANVSCEVSDPVKLRPKWKIIKRNNNGSIISNVTVSELDLYSNETNGSELLWSANNNFLLVGPVDDTYNNTSYQCIFTINDTIIESDTAGTITVIGMDVCMYVP